MSTTFSDLQTVPKVDLKRYCGEWYEIARLPNQFEEDCASDVTANYSLNEDGTIRVFNRCRESGKDEWKEAEGVARVAEEDNGSNSILEVRFAPAILSFLDAVWGDYRIIALENDYRYAMVGSNDRQYLWILSRTPEMSEETYQHLLHQADGQGFRTEPIIRTVHNSQA